MKSLLDVIECLSIGIGFMVGIFIAITLPGILLLGFPSEMKVLVVYQLSTVTIILTVLALYCLGAGLRSGRRPKR